MRGSDKVLGIVGALVLAVTLAVCGFGFCCAPPTTHLLASAVSTGEWSPYTHDQLVRLADVTRTYTVDQDSVVVGWSGAEVVDTTLECAREASAEGSPKADQWNAAARAVLASENEDPAPDVTVQRLAEVSDRYALDTAAMSHLDDCYRVISAAVPWLVLLGAACVALVVALAVRRRLFALALMLRWGPVALVAVMALLALWAVVDFNGLFAVFHSFFFEAGTWTFNYDSLLISMYPIEFWMGMAGVWLAGAVGLGAVCFAVSFPVKRAAKKQA